MSKSEVELIQEISRLTREYSERFASTEPLTNGPSPTFDLASAGELEEKIKTLEAELRRLRTAE